MELKLETMTVVQEKHELFMRNKKAKEYIEKVEARERKQYIKDICWIIVCLFILAGCCKILANYTYATEVTCPVIATRTINVNGVDYIYLVCRMPNGELHEYRVNDVDVKGIDEVTFKTWNTTNFESYDVVEYK